MKEVRQPGSFAAFGSPEHFSDLCQRVERIELLLQDVLREIKKVQERRTSIWAPIESLEPDPYEVIRPFAILVRGGDEGFEASFLDAGVYASGDNEEEAIHNLKASVLDAYDRLEQLTDVELGPGPARQKRTLSLHIRRKAQL